MRRIVLLLVAMLASMTVASYSQESTIVHKELPKAEIDRIIKKVSENEGAFREALKDYVFTRKAAVSMSEWEGRSLEPIVGIHL